VSIELQVWITRLKKCTGVDTAVVGKNHNTASHFQLQLNGRDSDWISVFYIRCGKKLRVLKIHHVSRLTIVYMIRPKICGKYAIFLGGGNVRFPNAFLGSAVHLGIIRGDCNPSAGAQE